MTLTLKIKYSVGETGHHDPLNFIDICPAGVGSGPIVSGWILPILLKLGLDVTVTWFGIPDIIYGGGRIDGKLFADIVSPFLVTDSAGYVIKGREGIPIDLLM